MADIKPNLPKPVVHGWLNLDKPLGLTSTQALGKARRLLNGRKAGHGGTLDPLATGVLPLAFGEATKLIPYVMDGNKEYEFTVKWGERRNTDDAEGHVVAESPARPSESAIITALPRFVGIIEQTPPMFSAIKLDGERAYDIARSGEIPEMVPRQVMIYGLELIAAPDADHAVFRVVSGKGMYVRALARDLAHTLGTCGHVSALRRTRVGPFSLANSVSLEKLEELSRNGASSTALLAIGTALDDMPILNLSAGEAQQLRVGQSIIIRPQYIDIMNEPVILATHQGLPIAVVEAKAGAFRVVRGFNFS